MKSKHNQLIERYAIYLPSILITNFNCQFIQKAGLEGNGIHPSFVGGKFTDKLKIMLPMMSCIIQYESGYAEKRAYVDNAFYLLGMSKYEIISKYQNVILYHYKKVKWPNIELNRNG